MTIKRSLQVSIAIVKALLADFFAALQPQSTVIVHWCTDWTLTVVLAVTVDIHVGIGEVVAVLVADVALDHLSIIYRHVHKCQII